MITPLTSPHLSPLVFSLVSPLPFSYGRRNTGTRFLASTLCSGLIISVVQQKLLRTSIAQAKAFSSLLWTFIAFSSLILKVTDAVFTAPLESWAWPYSTLDVTFPAPWSVTPDQLLVASTCYNIPISPFSKLIWCSSSRRWQLPTSAIQTRSITNHIQRSDKVWCVHTPDWCC